MAANKKRGASGFLNQLKMNTDSIIIPLKVSPNSVIRRQKTPNIKCLCNIQAQNNERLPSGRLAGTFCTYMLPSIRVSKILAHTTRGGDPGAVGAS